jgi:hypothetical protein
MEVSQDISEARSHARQPGASLFASGVSPSLLNVRGALVGVGSSATALSSISATLGRNRSYCSRTALQLGVLHGPAQDVNQIEGAGPVVEISSSADALVYYNKLDELTLSKLLRMLLLTIFELSLFRTQILVE